MLSIEDGRLAARNVGDETIPLVLERDQPPCRQALRIAAARPLRDWAEEHQAIDQIGPATGEMSRDDRAPGMGDQRDTRHIVMGCDEAHGLLELPAGILG